MVASSGRKELVKSYDDIMSQSPLVQPSTSGFSPSPSPMVVQPQPLSSTSDVDVPDCVIHYATSVNLSTSRSVDWDDVSYYTPNEDSSPLNSRPIVATDIDDTDLRYRLRRRGVNLARLQRVRRRLYF